MASLKTTRFFKGDYKDEVKEQPGSASVVQGITADRFGIGYSGIGYVTSGVRIVPLAKKEGERLRRVPWKMCSMDPIRWVVSCIYI